MGVAAGAGDRGTQRREQGQSPHGAGGVGGERGQRSSSGSSSGSSSRGSSSRGSGGGSGGGSSGEGATSRKRHATIGGGDAHVGIDSKIVCSDSIPRENQFINYRVKQNWQGSKEK